MKKVRFRHCKSICLDINHVKHVMDAFSKLDNSKICATHIILNDGDKNCYFVDDVSVESYKKYGWVEVDEEGL